MPRRPKNPVHVVTGARRSRFDDIEARQRHYLWAMGIRTLALVLAIFVLHGPWRFLALIAGLLLPWISVTAANAPLPDDGASPEPFAGEHPPELPPGAPERVIDPE